MNIIESIKEARLETTAFNLLKVQEEYLFARGWKKIFNNMYEPEHISDYASVEISFSEDGYNINYAMKMQIGLEEKQKYG